MSLFQLRPFKLPSGIITNFKIECDDLTDEDWLALAKLSLEVLPPFGKVEGVPRGGLAFARALDLFTTKGGRLLIADDVLVSGLSMERHRAGCDAIGIVAFSRGPIIPWITPIFQMDVKTIEGTYSLQL